MAHKKLDVNNIVEGFAMVISVQTIRVMSMAYPTNFTLFFNELPWQFLFITLSESYYIMAVQSQFVLWRYDYGPWQLKQNSLQEFF